MSNVHALCAWFNISKHLRARRRRHRAWRAFCDATEVWVKNFDCLDTEQPDRLAVMVQLSQSALGVLELAYDAKALQALVRRALREQKHAKAENIEFCDAVAGNMIQVSHLSFPDLAGTYNYLPWSHQ